MATDPYSALQGTTTPCPAFLPGSVRYVWAVRKEEIESMPICKCDGLIAFEDIVLIEGASWRGYFFSRDTIRLRENGKGSAWGTLYEQEITGFHPGLAIASRNEISRLQDGHYILIVELWSEEIRVLGSLQAPMLFLSSLDSGLRRTDRAGSDWRFFGKSRYPACATDSTPETEVIEVLGDFDSRDFDPRDFYTELA